MRGRKPKPTALRIMEGNKGRRPLNEAEPELPAVTRIEVPAVIAADPQARAEWERLAPLLSEAKILTEADYGALLSLCQQWSDYLSARDKATSLVVTTRRGVPMTNPYISVSNRALANCIKLWAELGCTPSARSRVVAAGEFSLDGDAVVMRVVFGGRHVPGEVVA